MIFKLLKKLNPFRKKKQKLDYPYRFALVVNTPSAVSNGINDDYNKKIVIYKNGKVTEEIPYTPEDVKTLIKIREIPVVDKDLKEDFDFENESYFGEVVN